MNPCCCYEWGTVSSLTFCFVWVYSWSSGRFTQVWNPEPVLMYNTKSEVSFSPGLMHILNHSMKNINYIWKNSDFPKHDDVVGPESSELSKVHPWEPQTSSSSQSLNQNTGRAVAPPALQTFLTGLKDWCELKFILFLDCQGEMSESLRSRHRASHQTHPTLDEQFWLVRPGSGRLVTCLIRRGVR